MQRVKKLVRLTIIPLVFIASWPRPGGAEPGGGNEYLDLDIAQLMNITITSVAKKEQRLADAAAAVFVITQEDIRRSGATAIPDVLAMAPGLQVAKISASKWSVSSRGFPGYTSNKLLVLVDGRSVYSPAYSGTFWDAQGMMLEDIDRIEVIRGPGGTLWGANAVNGVINIITKKAEDTQGGLVRLGTGDQEPFMGAARYGGKVGDTTHGRAYLTYDDHGSNKLNGSGSDAEDDWQPAQSGFRLDGKPGSNKEWTLQGDVYKDSGDQIFSPFWISSPPFQTTLVDKIDNSGGNLLGRYHLDLDKEGGLTLKAYYDRSERNDAVFSWTFDTIDLDLQYERKVGQRQNLTMGTGYRSIKGDFDQSFQVYLPDQDDDVYSAFLQDEINLLANVAWLTLGSKYEHNEYTGSEWQPSVKLLWKPAEHHSLWSSASRAVRTPSMVEHYGRVTMGAFPTPMGVGTVAFAGNPDFDSEVLLAYEAGYRWQAKETLFFDMAVFYNDYDEVYTAAPSRTATGYDYSFVNAMEGAGQGFELAADWQARSWLAFQFGYSYLDMDLHPKINLSEEIGSSLLNQSSPRHQASIRSSITLAADWRLNLWLRYVDAINGLNRSDLQGHKTTIDAYCLLDVNLIWTPRKDLEVMLAGQNLTQDGQLQYVSEYSTPLTEIERGVYGKVTWRF